MVAFVFTQDKKINTEKKEKENYIYTKCTYMKNVHDCLVLLEKKYI